MTSAVEAVLAALSPISRADLAGFPRQAPPQPASSSDISAVLGALGPAASACLVIDDSEDQQIEQPPQAPEPHWKYHVISVVDGRAPAVHSYSAIDGAAGKLDALSREDAFAVVVYGPLYLFTKDPKDRHLLLPGGVLAVPLAADGRGKRVPVDVDTLRVSDPQDDHFIGPPSLSGCVGEHPIAPPPPAPRLRPRRMAPPG